MDSTHTDEAQKPEEDLMPPPPSEDAATDQGVRDLEPSPLLPLEEPSEVAPPPPDPHSLTDADVRLFHQGTHLRLYEKLGAHSITVAGVTGTQFAVWAPGAAQVSVIGDFNQWDRKSHPLHAEFHSGIWQGFVPETAAGSRYKYHVVSRFDAHRADKADPFAFHSEIPPKNASIIWSLDYKWHDQAWMKERGRHNALDAPVSIY